MSETAQTFCSIMNKMAKNYVFTLLFCPKYDQMVKHNNYPY